MDAVVALLTVDAVGNPTSQFEVFRDRDYQECVNKVGSNFAGVIIKTNLNGSFTGDLIWSPSLPQDKVFIIKTIKKFPSPCYSDGSAVVSYWKDHEIKAIEDTDQPFIKNVRF